MMKGELIRADYRSLGPQQQINALCVYFEYEGETYMHDVPNPGWSPNNLALRFLAYVGKQPTDAENGRIDLDGEIEIEENPQEDFLIKKEIFMEIGLEALEKASWFNPEGNVWDGQGANIPGMTIEPNGGNKAGVELEG